MALRAVDVWDSDRTLACVEELMAEAFREEECLPLDMLVAAGRRGLACAKAFFNDEVFCGFASWSFHGDITHVGFLAVSQSVRSKGYGSEILDHIKGLRPDGRLVLEIESVCMEDAPNAAQRSRRLDFYSRCGFAQTDICTREPGGVYDVLCCGGDVSLSEYKTLSKALCAVVPDERVEVFSLQHDG